MKTTIITIGLTILAFGYTLYSINTLRKEVKTQNIYWQVMLEYADKGQKELFMQEVNKRLK